MLMAKIITERAYIEPTGKNDDSFEILVHIKSESDHIFVGKVYLDREIPWIHLEDVENGDLMINNSTGMEGKKWNHIIHEILEVDNE